MPEKIGVREAILALKPPSEEVPLPLLQGRKVLVRGMTARERDRFEIDMSDKGYDLAGENARAEMTARCTYEIDGSTPVFTTDDIAQLQELDHRALTPIFYAALGLNGFGDDEEAEKN